MNHTWLIERPVAHRGLHDGHARPENSLAAFEAAVAGGYAVECDVHLSADDVPMVFHDSSLGRLTDEAGPLHTRRAEDLARLTLLGTGERIARLTDLLDMVAGRVPILIEMKRGRRDRALAEGVARTIRGYDGPLAVMSFGSALLRYARRAMPDTARGLVAEGGRERLALHVGVAATHGVDFVAYDVNALPSTFVRLVRSRGLPTLSWTVRSPSDADRAYAHVDQIIFETFEASGVATR